MQENTPRYLTLDRHLRTVFGEKVQKIPLDAGSTCPNRDGTLSFGGCTFCNAEGSGPGTGLGSLRTQWDRWRARYAAMPRMKSTRLFLGYIQSFTNTYGPASRLASMLRELSALPGLVGACIGTRPDCLDEEKMALMADCPWPEFWLEIGVQSFNNATLARINRGHTAKDAENALILAARFRVKTCVHLTAARPGESGEDFLSSVRRLSALPVSGVKLHNLYVPKGCAMEKDRLQGSLPLLEQEQYAALAARALALVPPSVVIHRLCADPAPGELIAPAWAAQKRQTLDLLDAVLRYNNWTQGCLRQDR
ncbi:TIGR01212 family radical SAM protein [uncultured Mailhella sp.]|uniref:TIGR01212 family radical SAM protein n=1 Tax=uncultured Mailhella sp. TaxID=1981031 RepID=UPI0025DD6DDE|nr:TIGR01212 family radical SAM protein [uncultured Mailhella sp.]